MSHASLQVAIRHRKLAVYIDFETLVGCVMDNRYVLCITVLVFGHEVWSPFIPRSPSLESALIEV